MWEAGLDEAEAGIKIAGRNSNNLRYANNTTLKVEREEELKSLLMKGKEESEKAGWKLKTFKIQEHGFQYRSFMQTDGKQRKEWQTLFPWAPTSPQMATADRRLKDTCSLEEKLWPI